MYVDDSGTPHLTDESQFYVISGIIVEACDLPLLERKVENFKRKYFVGRYSDEEIHLHEIYKSKGNFEKLTKGEKYNILNAVYCIIDNLPITIISVGIHKQRMSIEYPSWDIFKAIWTFMVERYDAFLYERNARGCIVIDRSTNMDELKITKIIRSLIENGSNYVNITNLENEVYFFPSDTQHGIQIADAASYCVLRTLDANIKFQPYWNIIKKQMRKDGSGNINGYGYKVFPIIM
ncbi:MAG TPA: DUF3800 domain-containing protein [Nitrososphaeraceae archaeon]|nr:DUF3800 domain-containing protein [Nitrososphaeraceae archaeon]